MNQLKKAAALVLTFTMAAAMVPQSAQAAKKIKLEKKTVTVTVGKTVKLKLKNNKKKVKWTVISGKKNVILSKKGKASATIKGKKAGKAKVQAKIGKKKYVCKVTVKNPKKDQSSTTKGTAEPGSNTGTAAVTKPGSNVSQSTVTPTPTAKGPSEDSNDAKKLKEIITEQRTAGATVSEDLQSEQYTWQGNQLTSVHWSGTKLTGSIDFSSFTSLGVLDVSNCPGLEHLESGRKGGKTE